MADELAFTFGDLIATAEKRYPGIIAVLGKPGVWPVVEQALREGPDAWPSTRLQTALRGTEYYLTTPIEVRNWDALVITDPATAQQSAGQANRMVKDLANQLGLDLTPEQEWNYSVAAATGGWDANRAKYELMTGLTATAGVNMFEVGHGNQIAQAAAQINGMADDWGVPSSDENTLSWARQVVTGTLTTEAIQGSLQQWAAALYPALADSINSGVSIKQYATPFLNMAVQELGINPNDIKITDPKWTSLFLAGDDKGTQRVKSMNEVLATVRSDPVYGFDNSANATQTASQLASQLSQRFGKAA